MSGACVAFLMVITFSNQLPLVNLNLASNIYKIYIILVCTRIFGIQHAHRFLASTRTRISVARHRHNSMLLYPYDAHTFDFAENKL